MWLLHRRGTFDWPSRYSLRSQCLADENKRRNSYKEKVIASTTTLQTRTVPSLWALPDAEVKAGMERWWPQPGTHMHVVDAVATYCSPVVTKVILNGWVPHLKFGREERRSFQKQVKAQHQEPRHECLQIWQDFSLAFKSRSKH